MSAHMIRVDDLKKIYGDKNAVLDGLTFSVEESEFVIVFGKSGCGKTTLLNILGGLDRPTSGDVWIDGENVADVSENELARIRLNKIGFVFQDYNLMTDLTVRENVALPLKFSKKRDQGRVDELLKRFDIEHIANETANRISGGEAQRAAIARAMMNEPKIILADEPTGNLDIENTENVIGIFQLLRRDFRTTIVLASHDRDLAEHASTRIFLSGGKAVLEMREP